MGSVRVLVVDDDRQNGDVLGKLLRSDGFATVETTDPRGAAALLASERFDAVIADLEMPEMSGAELLELARTAQPHARLVLVSASPRLEGLALDGVALLHKPIDYEALLRALPPAPPPARSDDEIASLLLVDACASFVDAVLVLDADANVVAASPSAERLLGATRAELLRPLRDYRARFGLGQIEQTAASALSGQTVAPHLQARTDVTPRRLRVSAAAVRGRRDRVIGAIVVIGDVAVLET